MKEVRLGVIGLGNIAQQHIKHVQNNLVPNCRLTAVSSRTKPTALAAVELDASVEHFTDYKTLIDSGVVDAILVATPTYNHCEIGAYALDAGLHVLMEKPIGLSVAEGEAVLAKVKNGLQFGLMLNQRTDPVYVKIKELVDSGAIGEIQRTQWTMTNWFRPEVYFAVSDWRATWLGEGGGLLVNQCIHNLDIYQWICGMPKQVNAFCGLGKYHDIEVEDEATAYFEYENGATGVFIGSTGEAPGMNRFDIVGDLGTISVNDKTVTLAKNNVGTAKFSRETTDMFAMPKSEVTDYTPSETINQHAKMMSNFVDAILKGEALIAPAIEGLDSLSLANGILLSSWQKKPVSFPLDSTEYQSALDEHIAASKPREKANIEATIDLESSYR